MGSLFSSDHKKDKGSKNKGGSSNEGGNVRPARKDDQITDKDHAILDLKNSKDRLKKYKKKLEGESGKLTEQAKHHIRQQQKDRALLILKLKRMKEQEVDKIDKQLLSVMEMIDNIEWEYTNLKVLQALQEGNRALNKLHNEMSYEDVVALLDETNEAIEVENQINQLIAGQFNPIDETELQNELAELMGEKLPTPPTSNPTPTTTSINLPDVPTHEIQSSSKATTPTTTEKKVAEAV
eukprot:gene12700-13909_t